MRFTIFLLLLFLVHYAHCDEVTQKIQQLSKQFIHNVSSTDGAYIGWWTATKTNIVKFAFYCNLPGWCGMAFQDSPTYSGMFGTAVVGVSLNKTVQLYDLTGPAQYHLDPNQNSLSSTSLQTIQQSLFVQGTWDLNLATNPMKVTDSFYFLFASKRNIEPLSRLHDNFYATTAPVPLVTPTPPPTPPHATPTPTPVNNKCPGSLIPPECITSSLLHKLDFYDPQGLISTLFYQMSNKNNTIYFDLVSAPGPVWMGIGFSPSGKMPLSNAVIFNSTGVFTQFMPSTNFDDFKPSFTLPFYQFAVINNRLLLHFQLDSRQGPILDPRNVLLIAASSSNPFKFKHTLYTRTAMKVNFVTGGVSSTIPAPVVHGIIMGIAWDFVLPFGYAWARYFRKAYTSDLWWQGHRLAMTIGFVVTLVGAAIAFGMVTDHFNTVWHSQVGLTILVLMIYQVSSGIMRPHPPEKGLTKSAARWFFEISHHLIGRIALVGSWVAIAGGILQYNLPNQFLIIHGVIVALWLVFITVLEVRARLLSPPKEYVELTNK